MKYYLSSFRLGNNPLALKSLFNKELKIAVIANSIDFRIGKERDDSVTQELNWLNSLGFNASELDLRLYFKNNYKLRNVLIDFNGVWVRGGNTFILRRAMAQSGFDTVIKELAHDSDFVYGGYSAGVCVLSPDLHGYELVDDPNIIPDNYETEIIWNGLGLIDYYFAPHYKSVHPEADLVEKKVNQWIEEGKYFRALSDGEVIIK